MGIWPIRFYPITVNDWTMRESRDFGDIPFKMMSILGVLPDELLSLMEEGSLSGFFIYIK
jgi:hypothetical protein